MYDVLDARYIQILHYLGLILHVGPTQNVQKKQHENMPNRFIDSINNYPPKYNDIYTFIYILQWLCLPYD